MRKQIVIALFLCLSAVTVQAQTNTSLADKGSVYSKVGIGLPVDVGGSSADGMGLWGVSYIEPYVASYANPAQWGNTVYSMASGGIQVSNFSDHTRTNSAKNSLISVDHFQLQLPIKKNKLGVSVSFVPMTQAAYQSLTSGTKIVGAGATMDTLSYNTLNSGKGGVNRFEIGFGWHINSNISVGYAPSLVFASIDNKFNTHFSNSSYQNVNYTLRTSGIGFGNRLGLYVDVPTVFSKKDHLSFGASASLPVTLKGEIKQKSNVTTDTNNQLVKQHGDIHLPLSFTSGVTYYPNNKLSLTTEGTYQSWSNYYSDFSSNENRFFTNRYKVGVGLRYFPFVTGSDKFLSHFKYRFGASYDSGNLKIKGKKIDTFMLSAGLGILSPNSRNSIDISLQYGIRGTKSQNLIKENVWGVKLSLNLAELFFFRPKLR